MTEHMMASRRAWRIVLGVLAALLGVEAGAEAAPIRDAGRTVVYEIGADGGEFFVPVNPKVMTRVHFPAKIAKAHSTQAPEFEFAATTDQLSVRPRHVDDDALLNVHVTTESERHVSLLLFVVDSSRQAMSQITFRERSEADEADAAAQAGMADVWLRRMKRSSSAAQATGMTATAVSRGGLRMATRDIRSGSTLVGVYLELENTSDVPCPVSALWLRDASTGLDHADKVQFESPYRHAGDWLAVIPPYTQASGIALLDAPLPGETPLMVEVMSALGSVAAQIKYWELVPHTEPEKPEVSIHVQALVGAMWLGDGIGLEDVDAASIKGLGVRASYELSERIAVEGEIAGASTGDAEFVNVTYDGMQGELVRDAWLGRVQFGGVLRLGEEIIPILRLGLGVQGGSHGAAFTPAGGGAALEPEVGVEFEVIASFGAGLDARLGENFLAGAAISAISKGFEELRSLEAGLHLGYAWKP